jgi:hypothetical protein
MYKKPLIQITSTPGDRNAFGFSGLLTPVGLANVDNSNILIKFHILDPPKSQCCHHHPLSSITAINALFLGCLQAPNSLSTSSWV